MQVEKTVRQVIIGNFPGFWSEDHLTLDILKGFYRRFKGIIIEDSDTVLKINWLPCKLNGKTERKFGDIAIVVKITSLDSDTIEGVAFLEAKKRAKHKNKFDALKRQQLNRIYKKALHSTVLFYDYENINHFANHFLLLRPWFTGCIAYPLPTKAVVVPVNVVTKTGRKDTGIYKFSVPFSYQLVFRYLSGLDLELTEKALNIAKGYAEETYGRPLHLLTISIAHGEAEPITIDFNRDVYSPID